MGIAVAKTNHAWEARRRRRAQGAQDQALVDRKKFVRIRDNGRVLSPRGKRIGGCARAIRRVFRVESLAWDLEKAVRVPLLRSGTSMRRLVENEVVRSLELVREMAILTADRGYDFNSAWLQKRGWVLVPVEDTGHFSDEAIDRIVATLLSRGYSSCLAIGALDLLDPLPTCFEFSISADELRIFNAEFGIFRFLLTGPELSWAINCNEWFNLFAGPPALVEELLGMSIGQARDEFLEYAKLVEQGSEGGLVQFSRMYAKQELR